FPSRASIITVLCTPSSAGVSGAGFQVMGGAREDVVSRTKSLAVDGHEMMMLKSERTICISGPPGETTLVTIVIVLFVETKSASLPLTARRFVKTPADFG